MVLVLNDNTYIRQYIKQVIKIDMMLVHYVLECILSAVYIIIMFILYADETLCLHFQGYTMFRPSWFIIVRLD